MNEDDLRHTTLRQLKRVIWLISEHYYFVALWPESSLTFLVDNKILLLSEDEISLKTYFGMYIARRFYRFTRGCRPQEKKMKLLKKIP